MIEKSISIHDREFVQEGDFVVLFFSYSNMVGMKISSTGSFDTKHGSFRLNDMIGLKFGSQILPYNNPNTQGAYVLRPTAELVTSSLQHRTQILYHADIISIIQLLALCPGKRVIEAGTGSGSLTTSLARAVGPTGKVFTCEFHEERHKKAKEEFANYEISDVVDAYHRDVCALGFPEELNNSVDGVFLDLPAPWIAVVHADKALVCGGRVVCFSPCIEQVSKNCEALEKLNYYDITTIEVLSKPWHIRHTIESGTEMDGLPQVSNVMSVTLPMRGHTGYLTVATKSPVAESNQIV